jgi:HSP20 family protein
MKLTKVSPIRAPIKESIDRLFDPFLSGALWNEPLARVMEPAWLPAINFSENDKEFFVRLEVPGLHKENLDVNLTGDVVTLSGHREVAKETPGENYLYQEMETGRFTRSIRLPAPVAEAKVEATYADGVLTVRLPKAEPVIKNRIAIK